MTIPVEPEDAPAVSTEPTVDTPAVTTDVVTTDPAGTADTETTEERTYTAAEYKAVQREAQNLRKRLRDAEAQATELPTLRQAHDALLSEVRQARLHTAIRTEVQAREEWRKLDPELAAQLLQNVTWSDAGNPVGVKAALESVISRYPQLIPGPVVPPQPSATGGASNGVTVEQTIQQKQQSGTYRRL